MTIIYFKTGNDIKSTEIDPWSGELQRGEEFVWSHREEKGIFNKHLSKLCAITNYRIFAYNAEISEVIGLLMMSDLEDVVVMNTHRAYNSTRYGTYGSFARGFGVTGGQSSGRSVTVGDIVFMKSGKPIITWCEATDPNGLRRLTLAVKRELYPKKELQRFLTNITDDNPSIMRDTSACLRCGTKNVKDASFCSACGSILK